MPTPAIKMSYFLTDFEHSAAEVVSAYSNGHLSRKEAKAHLKEIMDSIDMENETNEGIN